LEIYSFDRLQSTQKYLIDELKSGRLSTPVAITADIQDSGVGSRDNSWVGDSGDLFLSFAIDIDMLPKDLSLGSASIYFSYIMKLSIIDIDERVWIKWPNDIYIEDGKIGGVITQKVDNSLICGIGLNLVLSKKGFKSLDSDISAKEIIRKYLQKVEKFPTWKQIFSEYQIEFELSRVFSTHLKNNKISLEDAHLCEDGSLKIEGKRVYSLR